MQCVSAELFPGLSVKISECVQAKLLEDTTFKMDDIKEDAADDIIQRLMDKRTMNNIEINYLKDMFQRARERGHGDHGMFVMHYKSTFTVFAR